MFRYNLEKIEIGIGIEIAIEKRWEYMKRADFDFDPDSDFGGDSLIMHHFSQTLPRDFDISPNFEVVKYNIICSGQFDYKSIWAGQPIQKS